MNFSFDTNMVNEAHKALSQMGYQVDKMDVYQSLLEQGVINSSGQIEPDALAKGLVMGATEEANLSFEDFIAMYPFFGRFNAKHFQLINGYWEIDDVIIKQIEFLEEHDRLSLEDQYDLYYFYQQRHISEEEGERYGKESND